MADLFPSIRLKGQLRPSQVDAIKIARKKLAEGKRRLHIVAPPGSGKTILGLYLWAECVKLPALVLAPNSAIQAQWAAKTDLFEYAGTRDELVSTESAAPKWLTSLTYQAVTMPQRGGDDLDKQSIDFWKEALIAKGQAQDPDEATAWIDDLRQHNKSYFDQRLSAYRKQVRDVAALGGDSLKTLHGASLATLERLKHQGLGLIIFDECHHLMEHWGRVLAAAHEMLGDPIVVGLTATPPDRDGKQAADIQRYDEFFGEIDYEVPVPAVVKDGFLSPYQDLAYFVRPARDELNFVAKADEQLHALVEELCAVGEESGQGLEVRGQEARIGARPIRPRANDLDSTPAPPLNAEYSVPNSDPSPSESPPPRRESLTRWVTRVLAERRLPAGMMKDWGTFERRDPDFANAARVFLLRREIELPEGVPAPLLDVAAEDVPEMSVLVPVLDRYVRHRLRTSKDSSDHELAEQAIRRLRTLGSRFR